jgi:hypothetical protein
VTPYQLKAARALLGWSQTQLGLRSNTSAYVVKKFELTGQVASVHGRPDLTDPLAAIRATLEAAGVKFTNGEALGGVAAKTTPITPGQIEAARKLLGWSRTQLGVRSGTSVHVVQTFELTGQVAKLYGRPTKQVDTVAAIRAALEAAGIEFSDRRVPGMSGSQPGPRLRKPAGAE